MFIIQREGKGIRKGAPKLLLMTINILRLLCLEFCFFFGFFVCKLLKNTNNKAHLTPQTPVFQVLFYSCWFCCIEEALLVNNKSCK